MQASPDYIGRFAPTPSGPLHFGSIVAALASYLDAKANNGNWLLRIDDLDTPRVKAGAADDILRSLERLGLHWDGEVLYQSQRREAYREAERVLAEMGLIFPCYCPRRLVKDRPYPGTCRQLERIPGNQYALRIRVEDGLYSLSDLVQQDLQQDLVKDVGDFIIRRADKIHAYHLVVVVDDAFQQITHMVRGADLMPSCPRQIFLQQKLGLKTPLYAHLPVAISAAGNKLSKQELAEDVLLASEPATVILRCLEFLGQDPGDLPGRATVAEVLERAVENWSLAKIPGSPALAAPAAFL